MQPKGLPEGIYFNLPIDKYHADPALSKSGMMNIIKSWLDYWENSALNPEWVYTEEGKSKSLEFGSLIDEWLFDKDGFKKKYRTTADSLFESDSRKLIVPSEHNKLVTAVNELWNVEYCRFILSGGFPQVSIFWKDPETGIMLKTRPDYLKPYMETDYKSIRDLLKSTITSQLTDYGYALQGVMGKDGITNLKTRLRDKDKTVVIEGANTEAHKQFMKDFIKETNQDFRFLFQRSSKPYPFKIIHPNESIENTAYGIFRACIKKYAECIAKYGVDRPPAGENYSQEIDIFEMPYRFSTMANDI